MRWLAIFISVSFSALVTGQETLSQAPLVQDEKTVVTKTVTALPEVGKHVGGNMDAMTTIVALLMVLGIIIACAYILKRFQPVRVEGKGLKIVTSMSLGAKERLIVVQVGDKQQLLGVTGQQITLLDTLETPLDISKPIATELGQSIVSLVQKHIVNKKSNQEVANNQTSTVNVAQNKEL